jgi:hypothetical protein
LRKPRCQPNNLTPKRAAFHLYRRAVNKSQVAPPAFGESEKDPCWQWVMDSPCRSFQRHAYGRAVANWHHRLEIEIFNFYRVLVAGVTNIAKRRALAGPATTDSQEQTQSCGMRQSHPDTVAGFPPDYILQAWAFLIYRRRGLLPNIWPLPAHANATRL